MNSKFIKRFIFVLKMCLFFYALFNVYTPTFAQVNSTDSLALVRLYNTLNGDTWTNNDEWLLTETKKWYGITLSEDGKNVIEINLSSNQLSGRLVTLEDLSLPHLTSLNLSWNALFGVIPNFKYLPKLNYLDLGGNELRGTLVDFNYLPQLESVYLYNNRIIGRVPDFSYLPNLTHLYVNGNGLQDSIPNFKYLAKLQVLNLGFNELRGAIPDFSGLTSLTDLNLSNNFLQGNIPNFKYLTNVVAIDLRRNLLEGTIPNFNQLPNLESLSLSYNSLTSILMDGVFLPKLNSLKIDYNRLNFSGIETLFNNTQLLDFDYSSQAYIELYNIATTDTIYVSAGGTVSNNTYIWFKDNVPIREVVGDSTYQVKSDGFYYCEVRNTVCTNPEIKEQNLILIGEGRLISLLELNTPPDSIDFVVSHTEKKPRPSSSVNIVPNPNQGIFQLSWENTSTGIVKMNLYNVLGALIYQQETRKNTAILKEKITINDLEAGIYFLEMSMEGGEREVQEIVIY